MARRQPPSAPQGPNPKDQQEERDARVNATLQRIKHLRADRRPGDRLADQSVSPRTDESMLTLVSNDTEPRFDRLRVVHAHLVAAISHLNNEAQARVPVSADEHSSSVNDLQLIVQALADIVDAVHAMRPDAITQREGS
jgi:hypothetical protein